MIKWYDRIGNRIEMKLYEDADKTDFQWVKGNVIRGYRYQDGIVTMKSDGGRTIWCGAESGCFRKSEDSLGDFISNADRIRSMSDEELEEFMQKAVFCGVLIGREESSKECRGCKLPFCCADRKYMKWLQSEVEE